MKEETTVKAKRRKLREVWEDSPEEFILPVLGVLIALVLLAIALATFAIVDDDGISKVDAQATIANDLDFMYSDDGTTVRIVDGGVLGDFVTVTSKRTACTIAANQAVNFKLTQLPLEDLLGVCASIR